jgi:S-adenosylmethionine decarboxylase proenzyme
VEFTINLQVARISAGTHVIINLNGCKENEISEVKSVRKRLYEIVRKSELTPLGDKFHQFRPNGVTGIILLSESHISIHTWPEKKFVAMDIFSCSGTKKANVASAAALKLFSHSKYVKKIIKR